MDRLSDLGTDTAFRLGDRDLATCLQRTNALAAGERLSAFTGRLAGVLGVDVTLLPATDDSITHPDMHRRRILAGIFRIISSFADIETASASSATQAADRARAGAQGGRSHLGSRRCDHRSLQPTAIDLADPRRHGKSPTRWTAKDHVAVVSPLFGGEALKGPAASVMADLGLPPGNMGVAAAYAGLFSHLFIDQDDAEDVAILTSPDFWVHATDTRIGDATAAARFSNEVLAIIDTAPATAPVR